MANGKFKQEELSSILKGIRYIYGYTQPDLAKLLCVGSGTVHRWENNIARPKRRKDNLQKLLKRIPYSNEELIYYGNINIKKLIEEIRKEYNLSYRQCAQILDICDATIKWIKDEKIKLRPYIITRILKRYKKFIDSKDKGGILFDLYKAELTNKESLKLKSVKRYPEIIKLKNENNEGSKFEKKVAKIFKKAGFKIFLNPILADKKLKIRHCTDIYAIKKNLKIIIECKASKEKQLKNKLKSYCDKLSELKSICSKVVIVTQFKTSKIGKAIQEKRGIVILDIEDLKKMAKRRNFVHNLLKKKESDLPKEINNKDDLNKFMQYSNLSCKQIAMLIDYSPVQILRVAKGQRNLTENIKKKVNELMKKTKTNLRKTHFYANYLIANSIYSRSKDKKQKMWKEANRNLKTRKAINYARELSHKAKALDIKNKAIVTLSEDVRNLEFLRKEIKIITYNEEFDEILSKALAQFS